MQKKFFLILFLLAITSISYAAEISSFVILGTNSVYLESKATIKSGNIGVINSTQGPWLSSNSELTIGDKSYIANNTFIYADTVTIMAKASVYDAYYNEITNSGVIRGTYVTPLSLPLDVSLPHFATPNPGDENITVSQSQTINLNPGSYKDVIINNKGTLVLSGGSYNFRNLTFQGSKAKIVVNSATDLTIAQYFIASRADIQGESILIYVNGSSSNIDTPAVKIGPNSIINSNIYAPNGTIYIYPGTIFEGAVIAKDVKIGSNVEISLKNEFSSQDKEATVSISAVPQNIRKGDSTTLTWQSKNAISCEITPDIGSVDLNGSFTVYPKDTKTYTITATGKINTATASVTVFILGSRPPQIFLDSNSYTILENETLSFEVKATDPDAETLTFDAFGLPPNASFNADTHIFSWTPNYKQSGRYTVTFSVTDPTNLSASDNVEINVSDVNRPPEFQPLAPITAEVDLLTTIKVTAIDPDGDPVTYSLNQAPDGMTIDSDTGDISWIPTQDQIGDHDISVNAKDTIYDTNMTYMISVVEKKDRIPPVLNLIVPTQIGTSEVLEIRVTATDNIAVTQVFIHVDGVLVKKFVAEPYSFNYNTPPQSGGSIIIKAEAMDAAGNTSSDSATVTITENLDDIPPVISKFSLPNTAASEEKITVLSEVSDNTSLADVSFYINDSKIISLNTPPYEAVLTIPNDTQIGTELTISIIAKDKAGNTSRLDKSITIVDAPDTEAPSSVEIIVSAEAIFMSQIQIQATASDNIGISKVVFFADGSKIDEDNEAPYEISYIIPDSKVVGSSISFTAKAFDFSSNETESQPVSTRIIAPESGFIIGKVFDNSNDIPISNVSVEVISLDDQLTSDIIQSNTNSKGKYCISLKQGKALILISKPGYMSLYREIDVIAGKVVTALDVRLTKESENSQFVNHFSGGSFKFESLNAEITIPAGCFSNDINLTLTKLSQQALTFPLPIGWTPVSA
ncbi:MAG: carboxypeptidase regulatory-like domain-containing protein, partial [Desulfobacterales bacterium]|nr:carboxypeptidase regulatory-like domain-containing protein [Desulfobacterales bacterium]